MSRRTKRESVSWDSDTFDTAAPNEESIVNTIKLPLLFLGRILNDI